MKSLEVFSKAKIDTEPFCQTLQLEFELLLKAFCEFLCESEPIIWNRIQAESGELSIRCFDGCPNKPGKRPHVLFEVRYAFGNQPGEHVILQVKIIDDNELEKILFCDTGRLSCSHSSQFVDSACRNGYITRSELNNVFFSLILKSLKRYQAKRRFGVCGGVSWMSATETTELIRKHLLG